MSKKEISRQRFLEDEGFDSRKAGQWSFCHKKKKIIAFGQWKDEEGKILGEDWNLDKKDGIKASYTISLKHIRLIEEEGYELRTFSQEKKDGGGIKDFDKHLVKKSLKKRGNAWYAEDAEFSLAEEITDEKQEKYPEGGKKKITVNTYERNSEARRKCIEHHGSECSVCNFDFGKIYGKDYEGFIHVHHIKPISEMPENYEIDPQKDLIPVCPNCHAIIHYGNKTLTMKEIEKILKQ